ncbi:hypothetical protein CLV62_112111 [Dysgonomonas alginatilytica]|uniref:Uncharacterized protein n=1 Tax=Dysgonomonas alginatilytica TaxID=1605892 RepID=A0A2V3PN67_9BACT|nr:hypothetical protein [Dysgonomonas alginatilytica]PXV63862.1 hypothetical protein CLV62_112111 [Dysgonomonas alginatilytica]
MQSVKGYFTIMYTVYISMLLLPSVFLFLALANKKHNDFSKYDIPYIIADGIVIAFGFYAAYFYSQKKIKEAKRKRGLHEKLSKYQKVLFIPWIILDMIAVFSIVCYIITGELIFVCITIFSLVILFLNKPNLSNIVERLDLPEDEQRVLQNPKSAI